MRYKLKKWYPGIPEEYKEKDLIVEDRESGLFVYSLNSDPIEFESLVKRESEYWERGFLSADGGYLFTGDKCYIKRGSCYAMKDFNYFDDTIDFSYSIYKYEESARRIGRQRKVYSIDKISVCMLDIGFSLNDISNLIVSLEKTH